MAGNEYSKTLQDELDWKLLDQLHGAVSQISSFCFEIKKFCVTTLFVVITIIIKLTENKLDQSVFTAGLMIPCSFWLLDATGYFYQVKLRGVMEKIRLRLVSRCEHYIVEIDSEQIIDQSRLPANTHKRVIASFFNHSMWIYLILIIFDISLWALFRSGYIK